MFARKYGMRDITLDGNIDADLQDGQVLELGSLSIHVMQLPGHTPDHTGYIVGRNVFMGDPDLTARHDCVQSDFGGESAHQLWMSIQRLLGLPRDYCIYTSQSSRSLEHGKAFLTVEELRATYKSLVGV